jgi:hypothetical protein
MKTFRQLIIDRLYDKISLITLDNGYLSDLGLNVFRGYINTSLIPSAEFVLILDSNEKKYTQGTKSHVKVILEIDFLIFFSRDGLEHPYDRARELLGDVQQALFLEPGIAIKLTQAADTKDILNYIESSVIYENEMNLIQIDLKCDLTYVYDLSNVFSVP